MELNEVLSIATMIMFGIAFMYFHIIILEMYEDDDFDNYAFTANMRTLCGLVIILCGSYLFFSRFL